MSDRQPDPELIDDDNPEITRKELRQARPAAEVLPKYIGEKPTAELLENSRRRQLARDREQNSKS